jgi:hypothetical protein
MRQTKLRTGNIGTPPMRKRRTLVAIATIHFLSLG